MLAIKSRVTRQGRWTTYAAAGGDGTRARKKKNDRSKINNNNKVNGMILFSTTQQQTQCTQWKRVRLTRYDRCDVCTSHCHGRRRPRPVTRRIATSGRLDNNNIAINTIESARPRG